MPPPQAPPLQHGQAGASHGRRLGLDVMRAAAIILVLISHWSNNILIWFGVHAPHQVFFAGDLGVQLFFALSGFLIGSILIRIAHERPTLQTLWTFLVRRWMRTLPLYFLWLAVLALFFPPQQDRWSQLLQFATMTQNLAKPMPHGWWFAVTWSLAVEEWFYLLFGTFAFLAFSLCRSRQAIWAVIGGFILVPLALRLLTPGYPGPDGSMIQVVLLRLDEIAYGVAAAQLFAQGSAIFRRPRLCLAVGLGLILAVWTGRSGLPHPLRPVLDFNLTILGCALLLPAALRLDRAPAWFARAARAVSDQSYAIYLIHLTLLVDVAQALLYGRGFPIWACVAIAVVGPFLLSWLSLRFFEAPILRLRPPQAGPGLSPSSRGDPASKPPRAGSAPAGAVADAT